MMTKHDHLFKTLLTMIDYYGCSQCDINGGYTVKVQQRRRQCQRRQRQSPKGSVFNNDSIETQNVSNIFVMFFCSLTLTHLKTMSHVGTLTRKAITYLFLQNGQDVRLTAGREFLQATTASRLTIVLITVMIK